MDPAKFFKPWEAPPHFDQPPQDSALTQRIQKLAQFASRNGPSFIELLTKKQAGNPEYDFLSGGHGSPYFRWVLYCNLHNLNPGKLSINSPHTQPCQAVSASIAHCCTAGRSACC